MLAAHTRLPRALASAPSAMSFYFLDVVFGLVNLVLCLVCLSWMYMAIVRARGWSVVKTLLLCLSFATMLRAFIFLIVAMKVRSACARLSAPRPRPLAR